MKYFSLAMSLFYLLVGCGFVFTDMLVHLIPTYRVPLGILLVGYGVVRFFLWRRKHANDGSAA